MEKDFCGGIESSSIIWLVRDVLKDKTRARAIRHGALEPFWVGDRVLSTWRLEPTSERAPSSGPAVAFGNLRELYGSITHFEIEASLDIESNWWMLFMLYFNIVVGFDCTSGLFFVFSHNFTWKRLTMIRKISRLCSLICSVLMALILSFITFSVNFIYF